MEDCLFCKIVAGEIPGDFVYRDEEVVAFRDINPAAPVHILIIPVEHIVTANDLPDDMVLAGKMLRVAKKLAVEEGIQDGYRLVINNGKDGGQVVSHLHLHLLGGRNLSEKIA